MAGAILPWRAWRHHDGARARAAALAIATALASPYPFARDQVVPAAPPAWLPAGGRAGWTVPLLRPMPPAALAQMIWTLGPVPPTPALPVLLLALAWRPLAGAPTGAEGPAAVG